jgi:hypothetical protein
VLIGRCPKQGLLLPLLPYKLLHLAAAAAAMRAVPLLTQPRLPDGDCMPHWGHPPPLKLPAGSSRHQQLQQQLPQQTETTLPLLLLQAQQHPVTVQ